MSRALLPLWVAIPFALVCLGVAGYLYWLASTKTTRKQRALPLAFAITLTVLALLVPLLAFGIFRRVIARKASSLPRNGVAPGTVLFAAT